MPKSAASRDSTPSGGWSPFRALGHGPSFTPATLAELLDGGQSFRWHRLDPDHAGLEKSGSPAHASHQIWLGIWSDNIVLLRLSPSGQIEWSAPAEISDRVASALPVYLFSHYETAAVDALPWRSDPHLARCLSAFPSLTILRQPFGETLLGFLCSATKQIVQIKQMVALLASRHGTSIINSASSPICHLISDKSSGSSSGTTEGAAPAPFSCNRLPTWIELASVSEADLRVCLLGFRARYIHQTAIFLAAHPGWLEETERLPYADAKARLCELPGVGEKVADCVLLFGAGRLEAFPVDTWIIKAMARRYALGGWSPAQVAHFGRVHFGAHAGLAQQYLFAYERAQGRASSTA